MRQNQLQNLESLLQRIASGDENAFAQLFKFYANQLNGYILSITGSQFLAEEMVQDVFLKIWLNRRSLSELACFKSYLFVVARNHTFDCLKQINRKKKREKEWINIEINASLNAFEPSTDKSQERIDKAVSLLPPQQKKIYFLRCEGVKPQQIAEKLNISVETVKKHMCLAMRFLRNQIKTSDAGALKN